MTQPIPEAILGTIKTLLTTALPSVGVFRDRADAFAREELPALKIQRGDRKPTPFGRGVATNDFAIDIEIHVRGAEPSVQANTIEASIIEALMADRTLGGTCTRIDDAGSVPEYADGDDVPMKLTLSFNVKFAAPENNLTKPA